MWSKKNLQLKYLLSPIVYQKLASTNKTALELLKNHQASGTVIIAVEQTHGHGRQGRVWLSGVGNIALSIILRPPNLPNNLALLPMIIGLAMVFALKKLKLQIYLKWPNDLIFRAKHGTRIFKYCGDFLKLGGILVENVFNKNKLQASIIGLGLNMKIDQKLSNSVPHVGCIYDLDTSVEKNHIIEEFLICLDELLSQINNKNFADFVLDNYKNNCQSIGKKIQVSMGDKNIIGIAVDIGSDGSLMVDDGIKLHNIYAGEITYIG